MNTKTDTDSAAPDSDEKMLAEIGFICREGPYTGSYTECVRAAYDDAAKYRSTCAAPGGDVETIIQRVIDELREEEHERRQEDRDAGISPDAETADQLATWANQLVLAKWRISEGAALSAPKQVGVVDIPESLRARANRYGVGGFNLSVSEYKWLCALASTPPQATPTPKATCIWPDCGHDTNQVNYDGSCNGKFCPQAAPVPVEGEGPIAFVRWLDEGFEIDWLRNHTNGDCYLYTTPPPSQPVPVEGEVSEDYKQGWMSGMSDASQLIYGEGNKAVRWEMRRSNSITGEWLPWFECSEQTYDEIINGEWNGFASKIDARALYPEPPSHPAEDWSAALEKATDRIVASRAGRPDVELEDIAATIVRDVCELEPAHPDLPDTMKVSVNDLQRIVARALIDGAKAGRS